MIIKMDQYRVVGNPIAHSKSPHIHMHFAKNTNRQMNYVYLVGDLETFEQQVKDFFNEGGKGMNVTAPFKERAFALCTNLSRRAQKAGAVNTLKQNSDGSLFGDTTDGIGMVHDIKINNQQILKGKRVLIVGAGGAVRGVLESIFAEQPKEVIITNRTLSKAQTLVDLFADEAVPFSAVSFADISGQFDLIINATSASISGASLPIPDAVIGANTWCYDMMYSKDSTIFLEWAKRLGAQGSDGLGMLVEQAAESFALWHGIRPNTDELMREMRAAL